MAQITWFVALPIVSTEDGFAGLEATQCPSAESARRKASALAEKHGGAVAFSRSGDPAIGEFDDAVVLARYGATPDDMTALLASD